MAKGSGNECFEGLDFVNIPTSFNPTLKGWLNDQETKACSYNKAADHM